MSQNYAEGLKDVLKRKIVKAERDLYQHKMDYCRFVWGVSHRTQVKANGKTYLIKAVDIDSMHRMENGEWSQPSVSGAEVDENGTEKSGDTTELTPGWELV